MKDKKAKEREKEKGRKEKYQGASGMGIKLEGWTQFRARQRRRQLNRRKKPDRGKQICLNESADFILSNVM